jgi:hypothetical protein
MIYLAAQHIGNRFYAAMRMPGEALDIFCRIGRSEIIKEQKRIVEA